jgi:hypothetical protein
MKSMYVNKAVVAFAALLCVATSLVLFAQSKPAKAPNVTYTATGTFVTPQVSGQDEFKLAGQNFTLSIVANEATVPTTHGAQWAKYTKLSMSGTVSSGIWPTPIAISSSNSAIELATGNPAYNVFAMFFPITEIGQTFYITAVLQMPTGTMTKPLIGPFTAPVTLGPTSGSVTYLSPSTGTSTVLNIASGTLSSTVSGAPTTH